MPYIVSNVLQRTLMMQPYRLKMLSKKINKYTWSLDDEFIEPEDLWAFTYVSPPRTLAMKNCLDDEMVFGTYATCCDN
jgi:hypothetical protein